MPLLFEQVTQPGKKRPRSRARNPSSSSWTRIRDQRAGASYQADRTATKTDSLPGRPGGHAPALAFSSTREDAAQRSDDLRIVLRAQRLRVDQEHAAAGVAFAEMHWHGTRL